MPLISKNQIGVIIGISIIVSLASLMSLPLMNSESSAQVSFQKSMNKFQPSENLLDLITQEKIELESKSGVKFKLP